MPAQMASLPDSTVRLLHELRTALASNSFMVNGGRLGFPLKVRVHWMVCSSGWGAQQHALVPNLFLQHAYPKSLVDGITEQVGNMAW